MGKKKKKKRSMWERLAQPGVMDSFLSAFNHFYGGAKGMKLNRETGKYYKPDPSGRPRKANKQ